MKPLISVIVPVFKVEDCLECCLDSLCRQHLSTIEIILIDDASPDKCSDICEAYAAKDARFRAFHNKVNKGLSVARNIGIAHATGKYLMFVDSDDYVHVDFCKDAYEAAEFYQADLVMFRFLRVYKNANFRETHNNIISFRPNGYITRFEAIGLLQGDVDDGVGQAAWNKIYRKELFKDISYPPGYLYEDVGTTYKLVWKATCIYFLDKVLYYKTNRPNSITSMKSEKAMQDWVEMHLQQYHDLMEWGYPLDKLDVLVKNVALNYCMKKNPDNFDGNYIYCANVLCNSKGIPANFSWKRKVLLVLFKYCRPLFELICVLHNRKIC